jgi:hypothetical protein
MGQTDESWARRRVSQVLQFILDVMHLADQSFGMLSKFQPCSGRCYTTGVTRHKLYTKFVLKTPQIQTKSRLRDVEVT